MIHARAAMRPVLWLKKQNDRETQVVTKISLMVAAALVAGPIAANASSVTYDFTGTVSGIYGTSGSPVAVGDTVTGTYTIDVSNGVASQSTLPVSTTAPWVSANQSGSYFGIAPNSTFVFSSTAQVVSPSNAVVASYSTAPVAGSYYSYSLVKGNSPALTYLAQEQNYTGSSFANGSQSEFSLTNSSGTVNSADGLPLFTTGVSTGSGYFNTLINSAQDQIQYNITSITAVAPVPLPAAAWLMLSGLGGIGVFVRKKRAA